MRKVLCIAAAFLLSGCFAAAAPLATPAFESATTMAGTAGSTATGYLATESTKQLNKANVELVHAQAAMLKAQQRDLAHKRQQTASERATVVGILRDRAISEHDYKFADLAMWVNAGGDPQFAMKYLLDHEHNDREANSLTGGDQSIALQGGANPSANQKPGHSQMPSGQQGSLRLPSNAN